MTDLKPHEQDKMRHLLNAFEAAPAAVQEEAYRELSRRRIDRMKAEGVPGEPLRIIAR